MILTLPGTDKTDILSMERHEIKAALSKMGQQSYRADQLFARLHRYVGGFDDFTELPETLRAELAKRFMITQLDIRENQVSKDGTVKLLQKTTDGNFIESVIMRYKHGNSLCLSTQVGCRMGCDFCASTKGGLIRGLAPSEMLMQVKLASGFISERISNIVLMGIGEPLDNFESVVCFLKLVGDKNSFNIGQRHITLSTCGLVDRMDELSKLRLGITLSISLHAPDDDLRSQLMPINRRFGVNEVIDAAKRYQEATGRRVSYEYALIKDMNDGENHAKALALLLRNSGAHVNLIRLNEIEHSSYRATSEERAVAFQNMLKDFGINTTIRRRLGADISGACGQLRAKSLKP